MHRDAGSLLTAYVVGVCAGLVASSYGPDYPLATVLAVSVFGIALSGWMAGDG